MKIGSKYLLVPKRWDLPSPVPPPLLYMTLGVQYEHRHHRTSAFPNRYPRSCFHEELHTARCISHPTVRHPGPNYSRIDVSVLTHFPLYDATLLILVRYCLGDLNTYSLGYELDHYLRMNHFRSAQVITMATATILRRTGRTGSASGSGSGYTTPFCRSRLGLHMAHPNLEQGTSARLFSPNLSRVYTGGSPSPIGRESFGKTLLYAKLTRTSRIITSPFRGECKPWLRIDLTPS